MYRCISLIARPKSLKGSGDYRESSWLCKVSNNVTQLQCYVISCNNHMLLCMHTGAHSDNEEEGKGRSANRPHNFNFSHVSHITMIRKMAQCTWR